MSFELKKKVSFELNSGLFKKKIPKTGLSNTYSQISLRSIEKKVHSSQPYTRTHLGLFCLLKENVIEKLNKT